MPARVELWWARPGDAGPGHRAVLTDPEVARYERYRDPAARRAFLAARALLRAVLGVRLGLPAAAVPLRQVCPRCGGPHGRTTVDAPGAPHVSVSHAGELVAVAVADAPVGVDVQELDDRIDVAALARAGLAPAERAALASTPGDGPQRAALLRLWARKEAVLKAVGVGLAVPAGELVVTGPAEPPRVVRWPAALTPPAELTMAAVPCTPGYEACVAVLSSSVDVEERDGSAVLRSGAAGGTG